MTSFQPYMTQEYYFWYLICKLFLHPNKSSTAKHLKFLPNSRQSWTNWLRIRKKDHTHLRKLRVGHFIAVTDEIKINSKILISVPSSPSSSPSANHEVSLNNGFSSPSKENCKQNFKIFNF